MSVIASVLVSAISRRPAAPRGPSQAFSFRTASSHHVLVADGSRIYDVDAGFAQALADAAARGGPAAERALLASLGLLGVPAIGTSFDAPLVNALSLAIAQRCNLACGYCYADGGSFGGEAKAMDWEVARQAVEGLLDSIDAGGRASLAFMGGEPLTERALLRRVTRHAAERAAQRGITLNFALTTNATLLNEDDAAFLAEHGFTVTVSLDGEAELQDALRPTLGGTGSHARILSRLQPLLSRQVSGGLQASARLTVTTRHHDLRASVEHLMSLGFHSVGVSPALHSRDGQLALNAGHMAGLLAQMTGLAQEAERRWLRGEAYPFGNLMAALQEIHRGTHRPLPCGAGAGYLGVAADGQLNACHRFVGDDTAAFGDVQQGLDQAARSQWLSERHVDRQQPCAGCWARYLCGGGCHHEVQHGGRQACDFIRGWLAHCLGAYVRIDHARPGLFD
ncbi:radical SAM/SPASM domain-containing protein [Aquabacterium sp.]|uniref:radical SAM/SPASM domain-containing protein n=1 Tax=Aquabacterium sp. TaxID=1872578 RepID=UPI002BDD2532|nr:SPASM domain-containing protein [Aquabacterium sp.]HSW07613.1 SPASM domain-containing protein [Aquabacterium sp.]